MAVLGFPFEEAYREMDRLLDAAGGTGKSYGRNFQSGVGAGSADGASRGRGSAGRAAAGER